MFLFGKSHRQKSLVDYSPWVTKNRTQLSVHACAHTHTHTRCFWIVFGRDNYMLNKSVIKYENKYLIILPLWPNVLLSLSFFLQKYCVCCNSEIYSRNSTDETNNHVNKHKSIYKCLLNAYLVLSILKNTEKNITVSVFQEVHRLMKRQERTIQ